MNADRSVAAGARRWLVVVIVWSSVALFSVGQIFLARTALGDPPPLGPLLLLEVPIWAFWALLTVPIVVLTRRFPLDRTRVVRSLLMHGLGAILAAVVSVAFKMLWYQAFNPYPLTTPSVWNWFWQYFRQSFIVGFILYWAIVGVYHAFANYSLFRERELDVSRAREQLTEARLQALKMQLHPHFLFNTLNSISALVEEQPAEARRVIAQLADLLRASLRADALHVIALEDELDFLHRYLDIERVRFSERLEVEVSIEPEVMRAAIPSFLFQPLVENAIRHGIARCEGIGRISLSAARANGSLEIHVADNGAGFGTGRIREGVGLANTRRRLAELYGHAQTLSLARRPGGGTDVQVVIPFRVMPDAS